MYKHRQNKIQDTSLEVNNTYEGETIEEKVRRILNNNEPITDGAPIIWTERKDGVKPEHDIRTDRWELAIEAMDNVNRSKLAKREQGIAEREGKIIDIKKGNNGGAESIGGTE